MGRDRQARFGATNLELFAMDVRDIVQWDRQFDYIVCHGVFSWVPDDVRDAILEAARNLLAPNGVAYISYNVLPGFHARAPIREMMRIHTARFNEPAEKAGEARSLLNFLVETTSLLGNGQPGLAAYHTLLKEEEDLIAEMSDSYVLHEHLAEHNLAYYFSTFVEMAREHRLQYLGDSVFSTMMLADMPKAARENIAGLASTQMGLEQYRDFVTNRTFRKSLLCRDDTRIERQISREKIAGLSFRERLGRGGSKDWRFATVAGSRLQVSDPNVEEILRQLEVAAPLALTFSEVKHAVQGARRIELRDDDLANMLLSLYAVDAVDFRTWTPSMAPVISERPLAYELARHGVGSPPGHALAPAHGIVQLDPFVHAILPMVDGTRTILEITAEVTARIKVGGFAVEGVEQSGLPQLAEIPGLVEESLEHLRRFGLLIS